MGVPSFDLGNVSAFFPLYNWNDRCSRGGCDDARAVHIADDPARDSVPVWITIGLQMGRNLIFPVVPELVA